MILIEPLNDLSYVIKIMFASTISYFSLCLPDLVPGPVNNAIAWRARQQRCLQCTQDTLHACILIYNRDRLSLLFNDSIMT